MICKEAAMQVKPKLLWVSLLHLHDTTNGAAIRCRLMLELLARAGVEVKVLTATVCDDPRGMNFFSRLETMLPSEALKKNHYAFNENGIEYIVLKTRNHDEFNFSRREGDDMMILLVQVLAQFEPDVAMGYGGDLFCAAMRREIKSRGIRVVYALCNGSHHQFGFSDCDLVFTTSQATAKLYKERDGINVKAVGNFIDASKVVAQERNPQYITLINPGLHKGLAIFVKLAQVCAERHPELKFLVVKSAGSYENSLKALHYDDGTPLIEGAQDNPEGTVVIEESQSEHRIARGLANISTAEHTNDVRQIYAVSKVVVVPSLWHESWGRVATEATFNNIPVLCSQNGGLAEAMAGAGIAVEPPPKTVKDYTRIPTDEEIEPWVQALERLLNEDWTERCQEAAKINNINQSLRRLVALLNPLFKEGKLKKNMKNSWFFSKKALTAKSAKK